MSIETYDLALTDGAVLVDSVTGQPLPLSVRAFADSDEAESFLAWALPEHRYALYFDPEELVKRWRALGLVELSDRPSAA